MTTHYTMTIDVQAWRVAEDGSLPEDMPFIYQCAWGSQTFILPPLVPGNWIVKMPHGGLEQMTDEQFRECCTEVEGS